MTRIGILSFAHMHAHSYATCLNALPEVELAGIWDADRKRGRAAAKTYGTVFVDTLDRFLQLDLDGVIVCSENIHHKDHVIAAAQAGKWILCEKPLATTVTDAKAMIKACAKAGVGLGTAFPCRYVTTLQDVKTRVNNGDLGSLLAAACTNNGSFPGGWFADPAQSGGGAVMDHTVHVVDALRWITGKEFTRVYCVAAQNFQDDITTDDVGSLHLEMEGGLKVSHVASWNRPASFPTWGDVTMDLAGTKGSLYVDAFHQKVDVYSDAARSAEWAGWGDNADMGLVRDFVNAVSNRRAPSITGEDGLRAVEVTVASYRSAKSGKMVKI